MEMEKKMDKKKQEQMSPKEETLMIQNQVVNLGLEEENPGIGYEIVIGSTQN